MIGSGVVEPGTSRGDVFEHGEAAPGPRLERGPPAGASPRDRRRRRGRSRARVRCRAASPRTGAPPTPPGARAGARQSGRGEKEEALLGLDRQVDPERREQRGASHARPRPRRRRRPLSARCDRRQPTRRARAGDVACTSRAPVGERLDHRLRPVEVAVGRGTRRRRSGRGLEPGDEPGGLPRRDDPRRDRFVVLERHVLGELCRASSDRVREEDVADSASANGTVASSRSPPRARTRTTPRQAGS